VKELLAIRQFGRPKALRRAMLAYIDGTLNPGNAYGGGVTVVGTAKIVPVLLRSQHHGNKFSHAVGTISVGLSSEGGHDSASLPGL
jgi:hypothetical protein